VRRFRQFIGFLPNHCVVLISWRIFNKISVLSRFVSFHGILDRFMIRDSRLTIVKRSSAW
jgi:hypothetical protein